MRRVSTPLIERLVGGLLLFGAVMIFDGRVPATIVLIIYLMLPWWSRDLL